MISRPTALERYFEFNTRALSCAASCCGNGWMLPLDESRFLAQRSAALPAARKAPISLSQALYFEATAKLTGDMLVKVDRMSMANSLEVRCPLLDHELAELAAGIPHAWKMSRRVRQVMLLSKPWATGCRRCVLNRPKMRLRRSDRGMVARTVARNACTIT